MACLADKKVIWNTGKMEEWFLLLIDIIEWKG
jgi:hypothetical protein